VGRKLYHWFYRAGLRELAVDVVPYQVYAGGLPERDLQNWRMKVTTTVDVLIQRTGDRAHWEQFREGLLSQMQRPDLFYYCTLILVRGQVPLREC
jgi:hypothetical protein